MSVRGMRPALGAGTLNVRHPRLAFVGLAALGVLVLAPLLTRPPYPFLVPLAVIAVLTAWRSPAIPLALGSLPSLVDAIFGSDPLPKGGFTFLFSAWIFTSVGFMIMRGRHRLALPRLLTAPVLASCFLLGLMVLRLSISPDQHYGTQKVELYVADVLIFMFGAIFVGTRRDDLDIFLKVVLAVAAATAVMFLFELVTGAAQQVFNGRFSIAAQEYPIDLGRTSADGLLIAIYYLLAGERRSTRFWVMLATPLVAIAMIAAGSRGPVVAFVVGLAALLALSATSRRARRRFAVVGAMFALVAIVVPFVLPSSSIGRALSTIVGSASGLSGEGRTQLWAAAITTFSHHFALGLGTGGFASLPVAKASAILYPHNLFLEIASELGIVGLVALLTAVGGFAAHLGGLWQRTLGEDRLMAAILVALFLTALVNACVSVDIQGNGEVWQWGALAIGMGARLGYGSPVRQRRPVPASAAAG